MKKFSKHRWVFMVFAGVSVAVMIRCYALDRWGQCMCSGMFALIWIALYEILWLEEPTPNDDPADRWKDEP